MKTGKVTVTTSQHGIAGLDQRQSARHAGISASSGAELSYESNRRKSSIFTYALLSGLRDRKADPHGQGEIRVCTLRTYAATVVSELTDGRQTPTARARAMTRTSISRRPRRGRSRSAMRNVHSSNRSTSAGASGCS